MYVLQGHFKSLAQFCQLFAFAKKNVQFKLAISGPPEIWQNHQISRAGGPMVHCLQM